MVYLGVDWEARKLRCAVAYGAQPPKNVKGCGSTLAEVRELVDRVRTDPDEPVHAVIECGAMYWVRLLFAAGAVVHIVDGKKALRFAESLCSSGAKDDARDARTLAEMGRSTAHRTPAWEPPSEERQTFDRLARVMSRNAEALSKLQQKLRSLLRELMPQVESALSSLRAAWTLEFLTQAPTPHHAQAIQLDELEALFRSFGVHHKTRARLRAALLREWPMAACVAEVEAVEVRSLVEQIRHLLSAQSKLEDLLSAAMERSQEAELVTSIPGIGPRLSSLILAIESGEGRDDLSVRMGSSPVFKGSGTDHRGRPKGQARMRRSAHPHDRRGVYLLGRMVAQRTSWGEAMYNDGRARNQPAATAYRRVARSMLRIVSSIRRTGRPYDESFYIERLKAAGVPWAQAL